jgi:hypothetical protein
MDLATPLPISPTAPDSSFLQALLEIQLLQASLIAAKAATLMAAPAEISYSQDSPEVIY